MELILSVLGIAVVVELAIMLVTLIRVVIAEEFMADMKGYDIHLQGAKV